MAVPAAMYFAEHLNVCCRNGVLPANESSPDTALAIHVSKRAGLNPYLLHKSKLLAAAKKNAGNRPLTPDEMDAVKA